MALPPGCRSRALASYDHGVPSRHNYPSERAPFSSVPAGTQEQCAADGCDQVRAPRLSNGPQSKYCSPRCRNRASQLPRRAITNALARERNAQRIAAERRPCPYCPEGRLSRGNAKTCGAVECKRRYANEQQREWQRRYKAENGRPYVALRYAEQRRAYSNAYVAERVSAECTVCGETFSRRRGELYDTRSASVCDSGLCRSFRIHKRWPSSPIPYTHAVFATELPTDHPVRVNLCSGCGNTFVRTYPTQVRCRRGCGRGGPWFSPTLRLFVYSRDSWQCQLCGEQIDTDLLGANSLWSPSLDHIVPRSKGGSHDVENLQAAHLICNSRKGDRVPVDAVLVK